MIVLPVVVLVVTMRPAGVDTALRGAARIAVGAGFGAIIGLAGAIAGFAAIIGLAGAIADFAGFAALAGFAAIAGAAAIEFAGAA